MRAILDHRLASIPVLAAIVLMLPLLFPSGYYYRVAALVFVFALAAIGLKLPPMKTSSLANEENSGSSREASARLVRGPAATMLTWPGNSCTLRTRKLAALSRAGLIFGSPAGEGGTRYGSA